MVTRRGADMAVIVPLSEWKRLNQNISPSLKALLLSDLGKDELELPQRGLAKRRTLPKGD
jgi:antitoxin Phd